MQMTKENRTKFLTETFSDKEGYGFSYVPVSYTHLDVYKRQQLGNLRLFKHSKRVFLRNQRIKTHQQFFYPVSYTHLGPDCSPLGHGP